MKLETVFHTATYRNYGGRKNILTKHPLLHLVSISLLVVAATPNAVWAEVNTAPPLPGAIGTLQSFTGSSLDVMTNTSLLPIVEND
jgi:hypothetical protein